MLWKMSSAKRPNRLGDCYTWNLLYLHVWEEHDFGTMQMHCLQLLAGLQVAQLRVTSQVY